MAGFGDGLLNIKIQNSVFDQLSEYMISCCNAMIGDLKTNAKKLVNDENKIRSFLLENYLDDNTFRRANNMIMFRFIPEVVENFDNEALTYDGRVDIKIVNQNDCFDDRAAAYFVECKRVDGNKHLNKEYVEKGVKRFVVSPPHYSTYYEKNYMLGFVVKKIDIESNVYKIDDLQQSNVEIQTVGKMVKSNLRLNEAYDCKYNMDGKIIELRHLFADLSENM